MRLAPLPLLISLVWLCVIAFVRVGSVRFALCFRSLCVGFGKERVAITACLCLFRAFGRKRERAALFADVVKERERLEARFLREDSGANFVIA